MSDTKYSLNSAALKICGPDSGMKDPTGWVLRQIKRGRFEAYKIGRHYRMTQAQIDAALKAISTQPAPAEEAAPAAPAGGLSLTATSARRLRNAS